MAKIKIGKKEYNLYLFNMNEIKTILRTMDNEKNKKLIKDNYDRTSFLLSEAINKCNQDANFTIETWDKTVTIDVFGEIQDKIMNVTGLGKYFKVGVGKK